MGPQPGSGWVCGPERPPGGRWTPGGHSGAGTPTSSCGCSCCCGGCCWGGSSATGGPGGAKSGNTPPGTGQGTPKEGGWEGPPGASPDRGGKRDPSPYTHLGVHPGRLGPPALPHPGVFGGSPPDAWVLWPLSSSLPQFPLFKGGGGISPLHTPGTGRFRPYWEGGGHSARTPGSFGGADTPTPVSPPQRKSFWPGPSRIFSMQEADPGMCVPLHVSPISSRGCPVPP